MARPRNQQKAGSFISPDEFDIVCVVTADKEFLEVLQEELTPWFQVEVRESYDNLDRWTKQKNVAAVLLDIDTEGEDPLGGLPILSQLRRLHDDITLISLSRDRKRSVEKQAMAAGADAHFRNPVDVAELRVTVLEFVGRR